MKQTHRITTILFLLGLSALTSTMQAQVSAGTIAGSIADVQGVAAPGVTIEVENLDTGTRSTTTTDNQGRFRLDNLGLGRYRVTVNTGDRATTSAQEFVLTTQGTPSLMFTLQRTPATDAPVTAITPTATRNTSPVVESFTTREVQNLPQPNFVNRDGSAYGAYNLGLVPSGVVAAGGPAVGGQAPTSNNYHLDGIDNNNRLTGQPNLYVSNEATTEFLLVQNPFSPEFGHVTGGNFNTVIRSGTNRVRGAIYDYLQNRNFNALDRRFGVAGITD